jgi:hypothetical protein
LKVSFKKKVTAIALAALLGFGLLTAQANHSSQAANTAGNSGYVIVAEGGSIIPPPSGR